MKRLAEQLIVFAARYRSRFLIALAALGLLAGLSLFRIQFTHDVSQLFPDSGSAGTVFRIVHETRLANTVQLEFISSDGIERHESFLDSIAEKLSRLPGIKRVAFRYRTGDFLPELLSFTALIPRFFSPEILKECSSETAVRNALKQLSFPTPGGIRLLRNQPFGLEQKILLDLRNLDELAGMRLAPEFPYFASQDKHRAMIVFDADIIIGDADSVRKLIAELRRIIEPLPEGMQFRIISGCMHTLGNEEVLKRDAAVAGMVSLMLFLLIFLLFYRRDWRTLWIPVIPLYASLLALGIMTLFFREICFYVIGLGCCITGLAIDQGIHVYAAFHGVNAERKTAALTEPMMLSAATSVLVFLFLGLTGIRAYVQLAVFAGLSLVFSCILALIVLPLFLNRDQPVMELNFTLPNRKIPVWPLALLCLTAILCGKSLLKNSDLSLDALDGTPRGIRLQEQDFNTAWRTPGRKTAVIAASGKDGEEALSRLKKLTNRLRQEKIPFAMPPFPPRREQQSNRMKWRSQKTAKEMAELEKQTQESCKKHHLPEKFFQPFFDQLRRAVASDDLSLPPVLRAIEQKMIKEHGESASAVALVPDTPGLAIAVHRELNKYQDGHWALLSREGFRLLIREELGGRFLLLLPLSLIAAGILAFLVFRNLTDLLLAMVPVLTAFSGLFILGALTGFRATPAAAFALILLTGLAIDYGIYAVSQLRNPDEISIRSSVFLSAATTVAGAGALIFSKHPALFDPGIVLSVGITLACLSGLYLVPLLKRNGKILPLLAFALLLMQNGCIAGKGDAFENHPESERLKERMKIYPEIPFKIQADAVIRRNGHTYSVILAADLDPQNGKIKAAGVHPGSGMLVFRLDDNHRNDYWAPLRPESSFENTAHDGPPPRRSFGSRMKDFFLKPVRSCRALFQKKSDERIKRQLSLALTEDFRRIFQLKKGKELAVKWKTEYIAVYADDGTEWEIRPESSIHKEDSSWSCEYRNQGETVLYRNHKWNYTIRLKIRKQQTKGKKNE